MDLVISWGFFYEIPWVGFQNTIKNQLFFTKIVWPRKSKSLNTKKTFTTPKPKKPKPLWSWIPNPKLNQKYNHRTSNSFPAPRREWYFYDFLVPDSAAAGQNNKEIPQNNKKVQNLERERDPKIMKIEA